LTDPLLTAAQRTSIQNDLNTILGLVNGAVNGRTINGTAKYRANLFANYTFASADELKGCRSAPGPTSSVGSSSATRPGERVRLHLCTDAYRVLMAKVGYGLQSSPPAGLAATDGQTTCSTTRTRSYRNVATVGGATYRNNFIYLDPRTINLNMNVRF
jgi:hypothetical protein